MILRIGLWIEPRQEASPEAVLDHFTRKMAAALRQSRLPSSRYGGFHVCVCGARSSCTDHLLYNGVRTNSLCVHYLAHHRAEVPKEELRWVDLLACAEVEPTDEELQGPRYVLERFGPRRRNPEWEQTLEEYRQHELMRLQEKKKRPKGS